jgi:hypothetical protein
VCIRKVVGEPDSLVLSEDRGIPKYEEFHPHKYLPSRSIIHLLIRNNLKGQDSSLYAETDADIGRNSSLRKIRG